MLIVAERKTVSGQGYSYWHTDYSRAKATSARVHYLYGTLHSRKTQLLKARRREFVAFDVRAGKKYTDISAADETQVDDAFSISLGPAESSLGPGEDFSGLEEAEVDDNIDDASNAQSYITAETAEGLLSAIPEQDTIVEKYAILLIC